MHPLSPAAGFLLALVPLAGCLGEGGGPLSATFIVTPTDAGKTTFRFDASGSTGDVAEYSWDFGDGKTGKGKQTDHKYDYVNGDYEVTLTAKGSDGTTAAYKQKVTTGTKANQDPVVCLFSETRRATPNQDLVFDATASFDPDGEPLEFEWDFNYQDQVVARQAFANMGHVQYGHVAECNPSSTTDSGGGASSDDTGSGGGSASGELPPPLGSWPSLPALQPRRDAGHGPTGPEETYNTEFNGKVASTDPIQVFSFPSPATYYVVVKAKDPKMGTATGFLRIWIDPKEANPVQSARHEATLHYGTEPAPAVASAPINKTDSWRWSMEYPGIMSLKLTFTADNQQPELQGWICLASKDDVQCKDAPVKSIPKRASPITVTHTFTTAHPGNTFRVLVENVSPTFDVELVEDLALVYDTNPWFAEESTLDHSGH